ESLAIVTSLVPHIGYDRAAEIAKKAYDEGRSIEKVALAENILPKDQLLAALYGELK
ncbi:MAG: aspartate ammonia-lyase, partial [Deltaproteobacteria bacterium]|nr:aspartate ammonia-lyase [Deltaproteobacteria bacterium]